VYDDVLLPVAQGEVDDGDRALDRVVHLAERYDTALHVLTVVDPTVFDPMTVETEQVHEAPEERAEETVDAAAERARERGVDVVMATHGRERLKHALLGSITGTVLGHSPVPVRTVPQ